jgi:hypothetical protein
VPLLLLLLLLTMMRLPPRLLLLLRHQHCHLPLAGKDSSSFIGYRGNRGKKCAAGMAAQRAGGDGCAGCATVEGLNAEPRLIDSTNRSKKGYKYIF